MRIRQGAYSELLLRHLDITAVEAVARRAIVLDPTLYDAHHSLAEALPRSRIFEEAARAHEIAIPIDDKAWLSTAAASWCYEQVGDLESVRRIGREAIKRIEQAISFEPKNAKAHFRLGAILWFLGQHDKGLDWINRSLEIDPNDDLLQYNAACHFAHDLGESERAFDILNHCMTALGRAQLGWIRLEPDFDHVRDRPRYLASCKNRKSAGTIQAQIASWVFQTTVLMFE